MNKVLYFFIFLTSVSFALQDIGTYGQTYQIKEKNFLDVVKKQLTIKNIKKYKTNLDASYKKLLTPALGIPLCIETQKRVYAPIYTLKNDIVLPNGKVLYKKGYKFNILKKMREKGGYFRRYIIFIDADSPIQVKLASKYAKEADIIVTDGHMENLYKKYGHVYLAKKGLVQSFDVQCVPSFYVQKDDHFEIREYREKYLQRILK